jgi:hypothetical protein
LPCGWLKVVKDYGIKPKQKGQKGDTPVDGEVFLTTFCHPLQLIFGCFEDIDYVYPSKLFKDDSSGD